MSEMIERVGRALAEEECYAYDPLPYDARARAAIAAMREPTDTMIDAVGSSWGPQLEDNWHKMIDEALK
jgi:hypothetical protein